MADVVYVSQQSVLKEAGLWKRHRGETPTGDVDGENTTFVVPRSPMADTNLDDYIDDGDVTLYVDGEEVSVSTVDEETGTIEASEAPADGTTVTVDYASGVVTADEVAEVIAEAQEWIDDEMGQVVDTPYEEGAVPTTVRKITRVYAAGLLMAREYGLQTMTDESGKEGDRKLKQAEAWLEAYRARIEANGADAGTVAVPQATTGGRLFQRHDSSTGEWTPLDDENFRVNEVA